MITTASSNSKKELTIRFGEVTKDNWQQLRRLNLSVFPVRYSEKFYRDTYRDEVKSITKLAYHNDILVGAVCCCFQSPATSSSSSFASATSSSSSSPSASSSSRRLYIMTLCVLSAYRGYGIGSRLLQLILDYAKKTHDLTDIYLHVQTSNQEALEFYNKFGFQVTGKIENYYKRISPPDCFILTKFIQNT